MNETNKIQPQPQSDSAGALEDLVYQVNLCEGNREIRGAAARATVPLTLVVFAILGGLVFLTTRRIPVQQTTTQTVALVLQEGPNLPAPANGPAPAPARPRPPSPLPFRPPAPAPPQPKEAPPPPASQTVPATAPAALPTEDHSRDYGSAASGAVGGTSDGAVGGTGGGPGTGTAGSGGGTGEILDLDFSQVRPKTRPPAPSYPPLARSAGIQGVVAVQIIIGPDGVPVSAHAMSGPSQLRAAAETNSLAWRFQPFLLNGRAQSCRFLVTFTFRIK
jgi:protein TonB